MENYHKIMEKFWLVMAILTFIFAVYKTGEIGISQSAIYFLFPFIGMTLFFMRYYVRKKAGARKDQE
jgi:hypothetical protein